MESKRNETFGSDLFGTNAIQETWSGRQEAAEATMRVAGAPNKGGRAPLPRGLLEASLTSAPRLLDHVRSKNHASGCFILFGLRLIFLFFETLK